MAVDPNIKILLVEDSKITRKMELKALNEIGFHNVVEADDGQAAIDELNKRQDIGLIISDWNMPAKDGYELLLWVRASEKHSRLPFIMATGRGEKRQTAMAVEAGVSNFVTKPFGPQELKALIEDAFGEQKGIRSGAAVHRELSRTASGKAPLSVAHIQITDHLPLGVLKHMIATDQFAPKSFELETRCMSSWNPVQQALEKGEVDAAFILAPIAMDLFSVGTPIRMVLLAHKNGSICVRKKGEGDSASLQQYFKNKTFYIPHAMSIHHMFSHMFLRELGLTPGTVGKESVDVMFEVAPPVKMPEFLSGNPDGAGFMVAEPIGTKAIAAGIADQLFLSGELWENHPCCIVAFRDDFIDTFGDAVHEFTSMLVQAGIFIDRKPEAAAEIGVGFLDPTRQLGLKVPVLRNVLKEPQGIKTSDLFPIAEDFDRIQRYMVDEMGVGTLIDVNKFVDTQFAKVACDVAGTVRRYSVRRDVSKLVASIQDRGAAGRTSKSMLDREGKYLVFALDNQEYGIGIMSVKEIIGMMPIRSIPQAPVFVKGVINLRGRVIPVMDLRTKFGMEQLDYHDRTCIIVLDVAGKDGMFQIGVVVDAVSDVSNIKASDIEDAPMFGVSIDTAFILGMAKVNGNVKILLNVDRMLSDKEEGLVAGVA